MKNDDAFKWWRRALLGTASDPISGEPQQGFYKLSVNKDEPQKAVAIWVEDGRVVARVDMTFYEPGDIWDRCCRSPISYEDYLHYRTCGSWKDHPATADGRPTRDLTKAAPVY